MSLRMAVVVAVAGGGEGGCVIPSDRRIKGDPHPLFLSKWRQKSTAIISLKRRVKGGYCMKLLLKEGHSSEWGGCTPREQRVTDKFSSTYCAAESEKAAYTSGQWCGDGKVILIGLYCKNRDLWRQKANMFEQNTPWLDQSINSILFINLFILIHPTFTLCILIHTEAYICVYNVYITYYITFIYLYHNSIIY